MILIFTNSLDATTDLIIYHLSKRIPVFRLNLDFLEEYKICISCGVWKIIDRTGREVSSKSCLKAVWRKPFGQEIKISITSKKEFISYIKEECLYVINSLLQDLIRQKKFILAYPFAEKKLSKIRQLEIAAKIFNTPKYKFIFNEKPNNFKENKLVFKSLSGHEISKNDVVYTTLVDPKKLDHRFPWFLQQYIKKEYDITVFYLYKKIWCVRHKSSVKGNIVDWRRNVKTYWSEIKLSRKIRSKINRYMTLCKIEYGRLDFCQDSKGVIWFLEVNPNGQFAWMDIWLKNKGSLTKAVCGEIEKRYFAR
jgi:hypothetical protein